MAGQSPFAGRDALDPWGLFDDLPANVSVVGPHERTVYANRSWQATFNRAGIALEDVDIAAALHPDDVAGARDAWVAATRSGEPFAYRYRIRGRRGDYRWFAVCGVPTHPGPGGEWRYACVTDDVDDLFRYEAYLAILADVGDVLATIRDVGEALERIGTILVPRVCAAYVVYRPDRAGELVPRTVVHHDPLRTEILRAMWRDHPTTSRRFVDLAVRTGDAILVPARAFEALGNAAPSAAYLASVREYGARGTILVPICGRTETYGVIAIDAGPDSDRDVGEAERRLIREIARRAALALDGEALEVENRRAASDLRFLAQVGETMVESLDLETRLERFVHAVVPRLADWATVNLIASDGSLQTLAIAHHDPAKAHVAARLRGPYYGDPDANYGTPVAMRSGRSRLLSRVDERFLREHIRPETYDDVIALGADSAFIVPLAVGGDVYGTLSAMRVARDRPFTETDMWLIEELARRAAVAIDNARRFAYHTTVAQAFQRASLPESLPQLERIEFSAFYAPGGREATVGGDWYDAFVLRDGRVVVSIGDVAGSGLAAAVIMGAARQVIRGAAELNGDARIVLDAADRALRAQFPNTLVTAFVGILDLAHARLAYASAGHPPPFFVSTAGDVVELGKSGLPLGMREDGETANASQTYEDGALLVLYTDGLTESTHDVIAGESALRAALASPSVRASSDVARAIHDSVLVEGAHDDVAILAIRLHVDR